MSVNHNVSGTKSHMNMIRYIANSMMLQAIEGSIDMCIDDSDLNAVKRIDTLYIKDMASSMVSDLAEDIIADVLDAIANMNREVKVDNVELDSKLNVVDVNVSFD